MSSSHLEQQFLDLWRYYCPHLFLDREVKLIPKRRFRFDFVHQPSQVAIEINGGNWVRGRHTRPAGLLKEYEKHNLAQLLGYQVFILSKEMINEDWIKKIEDYINSYSW